MVERGVNVRISAKGKYALAAAVYMAARHGNGEYISVINIASALNISKIYLEQVFSLLKKGGIVKSVKGSQGGYTLTDAPSRITAYDVLSCSEGALFEENGGASLSSKPLEKAMKKLVFNKLDCEIKDYLQTVTLADLLSEAEKNKSGEEMMFYI